MHNFLMYVCVVIEAMGYKLDDGICVSDGSGILL